MGLLALPLAGVPDQYLFISFNCDSTEQMPPSTKCLNLKCDLISPIIFPRACNSSRDWDEGWPVEILVFSCFMTSLCTKEKYHVKYGMNCCVHIFSFPVFFFYLLVP